jgi:dTDP-4-amino-4,6-dideoxygalactose transaminase
MLAYRPVTDRGVALSAPWFDEQERARTAEALAGRVAGDGPFCRKVEARLQQLLQVPRVLLTTSCTHAMELALLALGVGEGDEVICPSFTFVSTANAVLRVGARPVFADIEEATLGLDPADVERRLTPRTRALLPVHYAGLAANMDGLLSLARARSLLLVEDAAHGLGGAWRGRPLGTLGDAGCFSFHETKNVTCGEGGALALRDDAVARRAEIVREKGTNRSAFFRGEVDKYTWVAEGSSYVLSDLLAALLDAQLDKFDEIQRRRARICERYAAALGAWAARAGVTLSRPRPEQGSSHHIFYLLYPHAAARDVALRALKAEGIQAAFHYVPLHDSPQGRALGAASRLPVTESVADRLLRLPLHPLLDDDDVARVVSAVQRADERSA